MSDGAGKGVTAVTALIERLGISTDSSFASDAVGIRQWFFRYEATKVERPAISMAGNEDVDG